MLERGADLNEIWYLVVGISKSVPEGGQEHRRSRIFKVSQVFFDPHKSFLRASSQEPPHKQDTTRQKPSPVSEAGLSASTPQPNHETPHRALNFHCRPHNLEVRTHRLGRSEGRRG